MIKGDLANTLPMTLWIHSEVLLEYQGRKLLIGPKKYLLKRQDWLWSMTYFLKPVIIYIDEEPNPLLSGYECKRFDTMRSCIHNLRQSKRAVHLVVDNPIHLTDDVVLFDYDIKRYG